MYVARAACPVFVLAHVWRRVALLPSVRTYYRIPHRYIDRVGLIFHNVRTCLARTVTYIRRCKECELTVSVT